MEPSLAELLLSGGKLMAVGMGIVYMFLALLVGIIGITSKLLQHYHPEAEILPVRPGSGTEPEPGETEVVAAIAAAIHRFRNP
jgi:oxaloacetate decarboxylase gamma subunit